MQNKITAKDFFLHIAIIALLYSGTVALLNLLFRVINYAFPQTEVYGYYWGGGSPLSLPVATLIVVFPLFLILSHVVGKEYTIDPAKKEYAVRKWLIYITLFIAGGVLAGDLITLIYKFIDGQEITTAFILKVVAVFVVAGGIFGYYLDNLKDRLTLGRLNFWRIASTVLIVGSIVAGFAVIGTPATQRAHRQDGQRISDLQNLQSQIINYWRSKDSLPGMLDDIDDSLSSRSLPTDPETHASYEYERTGELSFRLCATFERATPVIRDGSLPNRYGFNSSYSMEPYYYDVGGVTGADNWKHEAGRHCFDREIDADFYSDPIDRSRPIRSIPID
ncbi:MAG: DUF5671 domain-containing protein [bacterium]|nr:DUF5671 domain-containing protein [bacterium]